MVRFAARLLIIVVSALLWPGVSRAQDGPYPSRTVTVVNPYQTISGAPDALVRALLAALSEKLGQSFVIEHRPGADGAIGMASVAKAQPDGHTLAFANSSPIAVLPVVQKDLPYDSVRDFTPIFMIGRIESVVIGSPSLAARDFGEVIKLAREKPETVKYGVFGAAGRLIVARIEAATGAKFLVVPFKGSSQVITALLGGHIDVGGGAFPPPGTKVRVLARNSARRSAQFPDIPATSEWAPGLESRAWVGFIGPAGIARPRVDLLHRELSAIARQPRMRELFQAAYIEQAEISSQEFAEVIRTELQTYAEAARRVNVVMD